MAVPSNHDAAAEKEKEKEGKKRKERGKMRGRGEGSMGGSAWDAKVSKSGVFPGFSLAVK